MSLACNPGRLLCNSNIKRKHKNPKVENCGKNCVSYPSILKLYLYHYKRVNKTFFASKDKNNNA